MILIPTLTHNTISFWNKRSVSQKKMKVTERLRARLLFRLDSWAPTIRIFPAQIRAVPWCKIYLRINENLVKVNANFKTILLLRE